MMITGVVLNAAAFTGYNYLSKCLSGDGKGTLEEKTRHDKALEDYQAAMATYTRDHTMLLDWIKTNGEIKEQAKQNFMNTDYAFRLYNQAHPDSAQKAPILCLLSAQRAAETGQAAFCYAAFYFL